jgi:hypothetical protein
MTDTDTTAEDLAAADAAPRVTEQWTYGGTNAATGKDRRDIWYDETRRRWYFAPVRGAHPVVGCVYAVEVARSTGAEGKALITKYGTPHYTGQAEDRDWAASLEAAAHAAELERTAAAMERRAARDPELDRVIAPLERVAAGMTYAQRAALVELVTRKIYRADRKGTQS